MSLDLERHLVFYATYHHNPVNKAIHMICVPLILTSAFAVATYTGTLIDLPPWATVPNLDLNLGTIIALIYTVLYLLLEPVAGFILAAFCIGSTAFARHMSLQNPEETLQVAVGVHVLAWIAQFIGHVAFEGRAPGLLDRLLQALFLAPMFVWFKILFVMGYRPELQARVDKQVSAEIARLNASAKNDKAE